MRFSILIIFSFLIFFLGGVEAYSTSFVIKGVQPQTQSQNDTILVKKLTLSELVRKATFDGDYLDKIESRLLDSAAI